MSKVIHSEVQSHPGGGLTPFTGGTPYSATVVLDDGRVGHGRSGTHFGGTKEDALSKAIQDASSKPVPKK